MVVMPALALGQSLGEIARKEAERRAKNKEKGVEARTISDKELEEARGDHDREAVGEDADSSPSSEAPGSAVTTDTTLTIRERSQQGESKQLLKQEQQWRARAAQARARIEAAKERYEQLQSMYLAYGEYYQDDKGHVISTPEQLQKMTARAKSELEAAEKALEDLQNSARRARVPAGWVR
jgi:hypothetical protein